VIQKLSIKEDFPMFKSGLYNQSDQEDFGLMQKASFQLMSTAHIGGRANLGYTRLYAKNHLKKREENVGCYLEKSVMSCKIFKSYRQISVISTYY
jgi:hypothetical protein